MFEVDGLGQPVVVEDLDADWVLDLLEQKKYLAQEAERSKLRLAAHWCVLHPATAESGVATWAGKAALPGAGRGGGYQLAGRGRGQPGRGRVPRPGLRRAKSRALGVIAGRQLTLDLTGPAEDPDAMVERSDSVVEPVTNRRRRLVLDAHASLTELLGLGTTPPRGCGRR